MADYSSLTPDQMLALRQMGLLSGGAPDFRSFNTGDGPVSASVNTIEKGGDQAVNANFGALVPLANNLSARGNLQVAAGGQYPGLAFVPTVDLNAGPLTGTYGQVYTGGEKQADVYGGGVNLGPVRFNYTRDQAISGPSSNAYQVGIPFGGFQVNAGMREGASLPTRYTGGVAIPGLLGGNFEAAGEYTPSRKDAAVYARYRRQF